MRVLFKDKKDITDPFKYTFYEDLFVGSRDQLTREMKECEILSVRTSKVDNTIIKQMPNLQWVINRSNIYDNVNLKHCREHNIGVINVNSDSLIDWTENVIQTEYCLPFYTIFGEGEALPVLSEKFTHVHRLDFSKKVSERTLKTKLKETNTLIVALPYNELRKNMMNSDMFDLLPDGSSFINISDSKIIDNASLLEAINSGKIEHATVDNLSSTFRDELIATGKVSYTKSNAWKFNYDIDKYIGSIKEHVKALKEDKPVGVVLDRTIKKVNAFWA